MKTRRMFLADLLFAGIVLGENLIGSGCSLHAKKIHPEIPDKNKIHGSRIDFKTKWILYYASLAPSGHNSQPWRVRISQNNALIIEADPTRKLPSVDPENRELFLSLGAFVENLTIAARTLGMHANIQVIAENPQSTDIIRVVFEEGAVCEHNLAPLRMRRTVKNGQLQREIVAADIDILMGKGEGQCLYYPRNSKQALNIREEVVEAFRFQAKRDDTQEEFIRWLRLDSDEAMMFRDGITTQSMELSAVAAWYVRTFCTRNDFLKGDMRQKGVDACSVLAQEGGGWLILASKSQEIPDLIDTGRRFERIALAAVELGIGIHPMSQIIEEQNGISSILENHDRTLIYQFVLRIGYLHKYPVVTSLRRPVEWFVYS